MILKIGSLAIWGLYQIIQNHFLNLSVYSRLYRNIILSRIEYSFPHGL